MDAIWADDRAKQMRSQPRPPRGLQEAADPLRAAAASQTAAKASTDTPTPASMAIVSRSPSSSSQVSEIRTIIKAGTTPGRFCLTGKDSETKHSRYQMGDHRSAGLIFIAILPAATGHAIRGVKTIDGVTSGPRFPASTRSSIQ